MFKQELMVPFSLWLLAISIWWCTLAQEPAELLCSSFIFQEFQELWPHLSLVIDGGPTGDIHRPESRLGSTVIDLSVPGKFKIIRGGW